MELQDSYHLIAESDTDAVLHIDHICGEPIAHDSAHCSLPESEQYTVEDAAADHAAALRQRITR